MGGLPVRYIFCLWRDVARCDACVNVKNDTSNRLKRQKNMKRP